MNLFVLVPAHSVLQILWEKGSTRLFPAPSWVVPELSTQRKRIPFKILRPITGGESGRRWGGLQKWIEPTEDDRSHRQRDVTLCFMLQIAIF